MTERAARRLPQVYLQLLFLALMSSVVAALEGSMMTIVPVTWFSVAVGAFILLNDARLMWRGAGIVGRITINFGIFYWFWLGAFQSTLEDPPFPTPDALYPGFFQTIPPDVVAICLIGVNLFALTAMLGWRYLPQPQRVLGLLADRLDPPSASWLDWLALGLVLLAWMSLFLAYQGNLSAAVADLLLMRAGGKIGASQDVGILHHLRLLGVFGAALALARIVLRSPGLKVARYLAVGLMFPILFFGQGSRFNFGYLLLPAVLVLIAPARHRLHWRSRRSTLMVFFAIGVVLVLYQGAIRTVGFDAARERGVELSSGFVGHDHFGAMAVAVDFAETEGYWMEPMAPYFITHFIPRSVWPNKPYPKSWLAYNFMWTQGHAFNVTPSITGQYYYNWGLAGVLYIGFFMGWLARFCEAWFARLDMQRQLMSATVAGLLLGFVFLSFRLFYPLYFAYPLFGFLAYWVVSGRPSNRANAVLRVVSAGRQ
jgi:oligosaccharide repeat unit polymerase